MILRLVLWNLADSKTTIAELRRYLREFLLDPRVIEMSRPLWWLILLLFVLPTRPKKSAALYRKVWTPEGSPLLVISRRQAAAVEKALQAEAGTPIPLVAAEGTSVFTAAVDARCAGRTGDTVRLSVNPARFHFFDRDSGHALVADIAEQMDLTTTAAGRG